jgi:ubiquinone biosynthesis protein UbiJ
MSKQDLSHLVGDVLARRSLQLAGRIAGWHWQAGEQTWRFAVAEYLTEEAAEIAGRKEVEGFCERGRCPA